MNVNKRFFGPSFFHFGFISLVMISFFSPVAKFYFGMGVISVGSGDVQPFDFLNYQGFNWMKIMANCTVGMYFLWYIVVLCYITYNLFKNYELERNKKLNYSVLTISSIYIILVALYGLDFIVNPSVSIISVFYGVILIWLIPFMINIGREWSS